MEENKDYQVYRFDYLTEGSQLKLEHNVYCEDVDISSLITQGADALEALRQDSIDGEQKALAIVQAAAKQWEQQAAVTQKLNRSLEYLRTPEVAHTGNEWRKTGNWRDAEEISNRVYKMTCSVWEDTKYDRETKQSVPVAWYVTWDVYVNSPKEGYGEKIAGQNQKRYTDKAAAMKYLDGRKKLIQKVALSGEPEERRLLWMSRPCGTYCLSEREVYLQESNENKVWMFYHEQTNDPILAYALTLDGLQDGKVTGTIYPLDYPSHVERVKSLSCPIDRVTVTFEDGVQFTLPYQSRRRQINELMPEHGTPKSMQYAPESERELAVILRRERLKRDYHAKPGNVQEYMEKLKKASMRGRLKEAQAAVAAPGRGAPHKGGLDR